MLCWPIVGLFKTLLQCTTQFGLIYCNISTSVNCNNIAVSKNFDLSHLNNVVNGAVFNQNRKRDIGGPWWTPVLTL